MTNESDIAFDTIGRQIILFFQTESLLPRGCAKRLELLMEYIAQPELIEYKVIARVQIPIVLHGQGIPTGLAEDT